VIHDDRRKRYQCNECRHQTTATAGTIFDSTKLPLAKWFQAIYLISHAKNGISALELKRQLGVSYPTSGRDDDDRAMGQHRGRKETGERQCSGVGHCSKGQAHGLQSKRTGQVVRGFRCRRRWARGLWRYSYSTSTNALQRGGIAAGQAICPNRSHPQQAKQLDNQCSKIRS
jgi:hypothetical protein